MKKALLAVLIPSLLAGASSVSAFDLIKNDDITLNFNGDIDLKSYHTSESNSLRDDDGKRTGSGTTGLQTEVIFDDIDFDFTYNINDDLKFYSGVDLTADPGSETEDKAEVGVDLIWVGVKTNYGSVQWGNLETSFDPLGIDNAEIYGGAASGDTDGGGTDHVNAIKYDYVMGDLWVSATYGIPGHNRDNKKIAQLAWKYTPGDLQINGGFGKTIAYQDAVEAVTAVTGSGVFQLNTSNGKIEETVKTVKAVEAEGTKAAKATYAQIEVEYDFGDFTAAALISHEDEEIADVVTTGFEVDFTYQITSKLKLSTGADFLTQDIAGNTTNDDFTTYYVAGLYKFSKLVSLQMEIAQRDGDLQTFNKDLATYDGQTKAGILLSLDF